MNNSIKKVVLGLAGATILAASAQAGGFSRGTADTDILFEEGNFNMRMGATIVAPKRTYATVNGAAGTDGNHTDTYVVPSMAMKLNATDDLRCAGTMTETFGGDGIYGDQIVTAGITAQALDGASPPSATQSVHFSATEIGATCGYKVNLGRGNLWVIGGIFNQSIDYTEVKKVNIGVLTDATLKLSDSTELGYRVGLAYEIPEIALRVQGIYRSGVKHDLTGTFNLPLAAINNRASSGSAQFPQSFELKAQTGVAPGWLVYGSVKWTDWSVFDVLNYNTNSADPLNADTKEFFYKDGWTVSGGVGHKFNDTVSGSLGLTWDRGVGTTEDVSNDSWIVSGGLAINDNIGGQFRLGAGVSYLQGGSVAKAANCGNAGDDCGVGAGSDVAYTIDGSFAYALNLGYSIKF